MNIEYPLIVAVITAVVFVLFWIVSACENATLRAKITELLKEVAETRRLEAEELQYLTADEIVEAFENDIEGTNE